ncbi:MAG: hypothetical protein JAY74_03645 [Candidatus Thiodiazotropha taylori]|nr:hypothetical protein [Candidatus Thiodiazotropha taylori]
MFDLLSLSLFLSRVNDGENKKLSDVAQAIIINAVSLPKVIVDEATDENDEASEGRILTRVHKMRERNQGLVSKKKSRVLERTGKLECEVCGFDFSERYGELGYGFAECHNTKLVSTLKPDVRTKIKDLAIVCANCHRMLHRVKPWISIEELRCDINNDQR